MNRRIFLASVAGLALATQVSVAAVKPRVYRYEFRNWPPQGIPGLAARRMFEKDSGLSIRDVKRVESNWENGVRWVRFEV